MEKIGEMVSASKLSNILSKRDDDKMKKTIIWVLAIVGVVAAIASIAYAVYRWATPDYLDDFEDDFEDEFEDECFEEDEV